MESEYESDSEIEKVGETSSEYDTENDSSSSDNSSENEAEGETTNAVTRGYARTRIRGGFGKRGTVGRRERGLRTRGGKSRSSGIGWETWESSPFIPSIPSFEQDSGPKAALPNTVLEFVQLFITDELLDDITTQTNLYARQFLKKNSTKSISKLWQPVTRNEILNHLALSIYMGINTRSKIKDYWSNDPLFHNPIVNAIMSRNRYEMISRFLHFADNNRYNHEDPNRCLLYTSPSPRDS